MDEIINYVMDTPGNTNPNVLKGMLESIEENSNNTPVENLKLEAIKTGSDSGKDGDYDIYTLNHTWQEVWDAYPNIEVNDAAIWSIALTSNNDPEGTSYYKNISINNNFYIGYEEREPLLGDPYTAYNINFLLYSDDIFTTNFTTKASNDFPVGNFYTEEIQS